MKKRTKPFLKHMHRLRKLISKSVKVAENGMTKLILNLPVKKNVCLTNYNKNKKIYIIEEFKQCIHSDIKTYIDEHSVSSLVEANTMADDYAPTHKLIYLKNKRAGDVPNLNYVQNRPPSYNHFDQPKSGSLEKK